jgi:putative transposase
MNLKHARDIIEDWRRDYNEVRPDRSWDGRAPMEYAETATGL